MRVQISQVVVPKLTCISACILQAMAIADQTVFPTKGDFITINGTLKGNYKLTASQKNKISYVICPRIMSKDITIH